MLSKRFALAISTVATAVQLCSASNSEASLHDNVVVPVLTGISSNEYEVIVDSISITDVAMDIPNIEAIHNDREFAVIANLAWTEHIYDVNSTNILYWEMSVNDEVQQKGEVNLLSSRALPTELSAGTTAVGSSGTHTIKVKIVLDEDASENDRSYQSFAAGASFIPLVIVIFFAASTKMVSFCSVHIIILCAHSFYCIVCFEATLV